MRRVFPYLLPYLFGCNNPRNLAGNSMFGLIPSLSIKLP
ncbi:hypothetical protein GY50_1204 [Dehalococcoides mccartyi GY50]|nr:hypothetical protein GY50_1204 [Dehalococcoides mccartyi GY50]